MRLKTLIGLGAGAWALARFNKSVALEGSTLERMLPAEPHMWGWREAKIAVYEAGSADNPPLLLLHGHNAAASAMEMREPFTRFARDYHVYAPDLLGYGLSDRPPLAYTPRLYIDLIEDLLRYIGKPAVVVASSLTCAYAIEVAAAHPELVSRLVLICPAGVRSLSEQSPGGMVAQAVFNTPLLGEALFNALASRASIRYFLAEQTYHDKSRVTPELVEAYYRTAHAPGARYAPAAFVGGGLYHDASEAWRRLSIPVLIVWGREAKMTPASRAAPLLALNPRAEAQEVSGAGLLPHDEQPEPFANLVLQWLERK